MRRGQLEALACKYPEVLQQCAPPASCAAR
jgi:hypothetical protein